MPPHWNEKNQNASPVEPGKRAADFPARAWAIGQLVTLRAAIELLNGRSATAGDRKTPWPEFAEYGCFSCHHSLRDDAWRRRADSAGTRIGAARWGSWTTPLAGDLLEQIKPDPGARAAASASLDPLARLAIEMSRTAPDPAIVNRESHMAADQLRRCVIDLDRTRFDAGLVERLITAINRSQAWDRVASWDEAVERYLALVPLRQAWIGLNPSRKADQDQLAARLEDLRSKLNFPPGFDSPSGFDPAKLRVGR
jgi:hypothetical protein